MTEERDFLKAILERPDDDARKLVYADWLEEKGDPRAEYMRLMTNVRQERVVSTEQRRRHRELSAELAELQSRRDGPRTLTQRRIQALQDQLADLARQYRNQVPTRLQELAATLDPNWLAVVSAPEVEGCGQNAGNPWRLQFDLVCDKTWADMKPTEDAKVRYCESCSNNVHFCDNLADAREHCQAGHCIAVDIGVIRREGDLQPRSMFLGRPSRESIRQSYEEDMDPVSEARLASNKQGKKRTKTR